jgi:nucleoid-associated protein YgaU
MGKPEKMVVLAVLFGAALILALALTRGEDEARAEDPLGEAQRVLDLGDASGAALQGTEGTAQPGQETTHADPGARPADREEGDAPSLLLSAGVEGEDEPAVGALLDETPTSALALEPESDPSRRILVDTLGLRPSFLEDYMLYTLAEGDTWSSLAQRFYRDGRYTRNLHLANEDLEELTPGKDILVPVFDFIARDAGLQPGAGAPPVAEQEGLSPSPASTGAAPAADARTARPLEYEVRSGDTLSDISLAVFGSATRWKEILEANRDKLQRPESLQVGMRLRIPEGGKLPATARKPETKPKASERSDKTASTTKKKKVL